MKNKNLSSESLLPSLCCGLSELTKLYKLFILNNKINISPKVVSIDDDICVNENLYF